MNPSSPGDLDQAIQTLRDGYARIRSELAKVVVGQDAVVEELIIGLLGRGHCILEGVPGLAKTLTISTIARMLSLSFSRIQFTPDLMPSDITGTEIIEEDRSTGARQLRFVKGPIFAHIVLADEINRTPPKTQAALLEAMQENQVTAAGFSHRLPKPFFVLATQNPIEQEGTYPLPEAQLDRFMLKIVVDYPSEEEELQIVRLTTAPPESKIERILDANEITELQEVVRKVPCAEHVMRYATRLVRATRPGRDDPPKYVRDYVAWGAGPRASQYLVLTSKARAVLNGRHHVTLDDIARSAHAVLRHRVVTNFNAEADGITSDQIVEWLLRDVSRVETPGLDAVHAESVLPSR
ncbi:MAG: MoxR family ATPase [Phycisphaerae bacterium]|nr:MoxR family ATPase [Phycisphaerae bacterium]